MIGGFPGGDLDAQMYVLDFFTKDMEPISTPERYAAVRGAKDELSAIGAGLTGEAARIHSRVFERVRAALAAYEDADPNKIVCDMLEKVRS